MPLEAHVLLDRPTFMLAFDLHLRHSRAWRKWKIAVLAYAVLLLILGAAAAIATRDWALGGPLLVGGAALIAVAFALGQRKASQAFQALRPDQLEARLTFADDGVDAVGHGVHSHAAWSSFADFVTENDVALIYQTPLLFTTVPRQAFANDADWQAFTTLARTRIARQA